MISFDSHVFENVLLLLSLYADCFKHDKTYIQVEFHEDTSFNLVLFVNVDNVKMLKERKMGERAVDTQTAHFYVKNSHQS